MIDLLWCFGPPIFAAVICFFFWFIHGRDPQVSDPVFPHYVPPKDLTVIESGVLMDDILQSRDIAYELYDLYFKGVIDFQDDTFMNLLKKLDDPQVVALEDTQKNILNILFPQNVQKLRLSSGMTQIKAKKIKDYIYEQLVQKGYYSPSPTVQRTFYYFLGYACIIGGIGFNIFSFFSQFKSRRHSYGSSSAPFYLPLSLIVGLVLAGLVCGIWGTAMARKTVQGVKRYRELLGFKEFIVTAEKDRIEYFLEHDPQAYKDILPYAFLFGVKEKWLGPAKNLRENFLDEDVVAVTFKMDLDAFEQLFEEKQNFIVGLLNIVFFAIIQAVKYGILSLGSGGRSYSTGFSRMGNPNKIISEKEQEKLTYLREEEKEKMLNSQQPDAESRTPDQDKK